jgi:hypothetical protein
LKIFAEFKPKMAARELNQAAPNGGATSISTSASHTSRCERMPLRPLH